MVGKTNIEWTDASWNPIVGCSIVSPGCTNCYAMKMAHRLQAMADKPRWTKKGVGTGHYTGTTKVVNGNAIWTGKLALAPEHVLTSPLRRKKPTTYFVNSMGDLFHEDCPDEWIDKVFAVMALCPQHTFQALTKRSKRMRDYFDDPYHRAEAIGAALGDMLDGDWIWGEGKPYRQRIEGMISLAHGLTPDDQAFASEDFLPLPNVWLGVSAEDQKRYDERKEHLRNTPAAVRFFSFEPLIGQIIGDYFGEWSIVGGESGRGARPMHPDWARSLRDQCAATGVPFFFKQWGEFAPEGLSERAWHVTPDGVAKPDPLPNGIGRHVPDGHWRSYRVGKHAAGRLLDGREHSDMPEVRA